MYGKDARIDDYANGINATTKSIYYATVVINLESWNFLEFKFKFQLSNC